VIADASHELRTPLTSIRGYAEMLRRGAEESPKDSETARRRIEEESIRMTGLVDDLLVLARLDQGRPMDKAAVDLRAIATDAVADARVVAPQRQINLSANGPVIVTGDDTRLRQVLGNLVRNALVHTPQLTPIGRCGCHRRLSRPRVGCRPRTRACGGGCREDLRTLLSRRSESAAATGEGQGSASRSSARWSARTAGT